MIDFAYNPIIPTDYKSRRRHFLTKCLLLGGVFGAGDEARTRFPASHEWLSPFAGALPHLRSNVLRTGRGSEFSGAAAHSKKNTPSCRMGYSFWSGRRGSNSLPRPWQGRALPDELRPQMTPMFQRHGASGRSRTNDTRIFSPLLYQLSYRGIWRPRWGSNPRPPA